MASSRVELANNVSAISNAASKFGELDVDVNFSSTAVWRSAVSVIRSVKGILKSADEPNTINP